MTGKVTYFHTCILLILLFLLSKLLLPSDYRFIILFRFGPITHAVYRYPFFLTDGNFLSSTSSLRHLFYVFCLLLPLCKFALPVGKYVQVIYNTILVPSLQTRTKPDIWTHLLYEILPPYILKFQFTLLKKSIKLINL